MFEDIDVSGATHPHDRPGMARILQGIQVTTAGGVILTPDIPDALEGQPPPLVDRFVQLA